MKNYNDLPNTMYFGSPKRIKELKNKVFLTPHKGIASLFIIEHNDLFPNEYAIDANLSYRQWSYSNDLLLEPFKIVNVLHNIPFLENKIFKGQSSGYIHVVDVRGVKDKLSLFVTNDPDREVIYNGEEPLPILDCIPHSLEWDCSFSQDQVKRKGIGTAKKM